MAQPDTGDRIIHTVRNAEKPALSAADLAEELDVSIKTINNNLEPLVDQGKIETTQIGNATAYYISDSEIPPHQKPDHTCARCGRDASGSFDIGKIQLETYFTRNNIDQETPDFYILCRFCYSDLVAWLFRDEYHMGKYPDVHSWNIPGDQLNDVRNNPDVKSAPDEPETSFDYQTIAYQVFQRMFDDPDEIVQEDNFREVLNEELPKSKAEKGFEFLKNGGYFHRNLLANELLPAK